MTTYLRAFSLAAALVLTSAPAFAHSTVKNTLPVSGSVLPASPPEVVINFNEPASLTSIVVVASGKPERKLAFMPTGSSTSFMVHDPNLAQGRNEIKWKALSKDGHPIEGSIIIVIKPGATPNAPTSAHPPGHDGH